MKKFTYIFLVLFGCAFQVLSQDEDFAVLIKGDTLRGKMNIVDNPLTGHNLVIKVKKKKESHASYRVSLLYKNGETYHVAKIEGRYQFIKLVQEGFMSLYRYSPADQQSAQMFQGSILITKDGRQKVVPNLGFRKQLSEFLEDCESLSAKIQEGEYTKKNLTEIIDLYNACVPQAYEPKPGDIVEEIVYIPDTSDIDELIEKVKTDGDLSSNSEMLEMLEDVRNKLQDGDEVPGYLVKILKGNLEGKGELLELLDKALKE
ncbi:MAG: hypothetical protein RIG77_01460 [Cyclobacteriaceae bacterium]